MLGSATYKIHNESIQRIQDVGKLPDAWRPVGLHQAGSSSVALSKQIAQPLKGGQGFNHDSTKAQAASAMRATMQELTKRSSKRHLDGSSVTRNVQAALSELRKENRGSLAEVMKTENRTIKKMDNAAVVRGTTRNLLIHDFERIPHKSRRHQDEPQMAIHKLDVEKIRGFTNGYLYSQGKDGLLESLRGPFANRATSPVKQLQKMYERKNVDILNQSQFYMNVKLEREALKK